KQVEDQLDRSEVVELHGSLVVVKALVGALDGAANRLARVVDEDVDPAVAIEYRLGHAVDVVGVGEVTRVDVRRTADALDLGLRSLELLLGPCYQQDGATGRADLQRGGLANPGRRPGDQGRARGNRILQ